MQDALDWGQRYMTQAEWDGIHEEHEEHAPEQRPAGTGALPPPARPSGSSPLNTEHLSPLPPIPPSLYSL
jgi:hypothetical protein